MTNESRSNLATMSHWSQDHGYKGEEEFRHVAFARGFLLFNRQDG
ncbi:hypothetical protein [Oceanobacillus saliphilus]|nr:hypothetical protein [Oceanobacillus saliphilus]